MKSAREKRSVRIALSARDCSALFGRKVKRALDLFSARFSLFPRATLPAHRRTQALRSTTKVWWPQIKVRYKRSAPLRGQSPKGGGPSCSPCSLGQQSGTGASGDSAKTARDSQHCCCVNQTSSLGGVHRCTRRDGGQHAAEDGGRLQSQALCSKLELLDLILVLQ